MSNQVILDPHHKDILDALDGHLDHVVFEACAVELVRQDGWKVVAVPGGRDDGFDGAIAHENGDPFPLIATISENIVGNFERNVSQARRQGWTVSRTIFATSREITPSKRKKLYEIARDIGIELVQAYPRDWFAYRLYHNPHWCKRLLKLTGRPRALSAFPNSVRPQLGDHVYGRESEMNWLKECQGDCLLYGGPGSGKTFLLQSLVNDGQALFLVDGDREQLANDIRELQPPAIIVDDAHVNPDLIDTVVQLRKEIYAETIRVIATCWTSEVQKVRSALQLADQSVLYLDLIDADTMVEIIRSFGIDGPDGLIAMIREQAAGRPGLAATLVDLCLKGNVQRVVSGEGLVDQMSSQLSKTFDVDVKRLLAPFALGGDSGVKQSQVANYLGISSLDISDKLARLATAGVIRERANHVLSVEPASMRSVLIRDVFFGLPGSLNYAPLLDIVANRDDAISTLIWANSRGASIPDLINLVDGADSLKLWAEYAWLGRSECEHVYATLPDIFLEEGIVKAGLHHVPEIALPYILDHASQFSCSWREDSLEYLRNWIHDAHRKGKDGVSRRKTIVQEAYLWWKQTGMALTAIRAMLIALNPGFKYWTTDPGAGLTLISTEGTLPVSMLKQVIQLWPNVREVICESGEFPCREMLNLIDDWRLQWKAQGGFSKEAQAIKQDFARRILIDLAKGTRRHPGLQHVLRWYSETLNLNLDLGLDPVFEAFFPRRGQEVEEWEDSIGLAARYLGVGKKSTSEIGKSLAGIQSEARLANIDPNSSWIAGEVCKRIVASTEDPVKAAAVLLRRRLPTAWIHPVISEAAFEHHRGWHTVVAKCLSDEKYQEIGVEIVLALPESPPEVFAAALVVAENHLSLVRDLCAMGRVHGEKLRGLLRADNQRVASVAAIGYWCAEPKGEIDSAIEGLWRKAIIHTSCDDSLFNRSMSIDYWLGEILANDSGLAEEWLLKGIGQGGSGLAFGAKEIAIESVLPTLDLSRRRRVLKAIPCEWKWTTNDIVRHLVGQDMALFRELLDSSKLAEYHLAPLKGKPDRHWWKKAALAFGAGKSTEDLIRAADASDEQGWTDKESLMWAEWRRAFEAPFHFEEADVRILQLARRGIELMGKREERALEEEREMAVHGR